MHDVARRLGWHAAGLILALLVLSAMPSWAQWPRMGQEDPQLFRTVTFHSDPPGARIVLEVASSGENVIGFCDKPFRLDLNRFQGQSGFSVSIRMDGYNDLPQRIPSTYFQSRDTWPAQGALHLDPKHAWIPWLYFVRHHQIVVVCLVLAALGVAAYFMRREKRIQTALEHSAKLASYAASADSTDPLVMTYLGNYQLIERLGQGGTATVYKAVPRETLDEQAAVAVKVIDKETAEEEEFRRRFNREIKICTKLVHPAIVNIMDWGEQDGLLYLVMELLTGRAMRYFMKEGHIGPDGQITGWTLDEMLAVMRPVMQGVHYAHTQEIYHRDLKPENVIVDYKDKGVVVKIVDFGIARGPQFTAVTRTGEIFGTFAYLPPERLEAVHEDARSDEYALGIMAYELLAGRKPFTDDAPAMLVFSTLYRDPTPLSELRPDLPPEVCQVIMRMMDKTISQRYESVQDALDALERAAGRATSTLR
jgi:tRNA A-37 threonylcarbamoyl transferase component Bud32